MGAKSKSAHKKKKISKHVLMAREGQAKTTEATSTDTKDDANNEVVKRKQKKNRHIKDPSEAATYLQEWKDSKKGKSGWKFNKNTQSWLIRHMYEADKIPKGVFALLLEYLSGIEGKTTRTWIRSEASRRALRYKNYEKGAQRTAGDDADTNLEDVRKEENTPAARQTQSEDDREDEERWKKLDDHDKRKEYKRTRKILETISE